MIAGPALFQHASKLYKSNKNIFNNLQFFFDKGENVRQAAENVYSIYGSDTITADHTQSGNFEIEDAPRSRRPIID